MNLTGARKCRLTWGGGGGGGGGGKTTLVHDVSMIILTSLHHFHVSFCQTFRRKCVREAPYQTFLDRKI